MNALQARILPFIFTGFFATAVGPSPLRAQLVQDSAPSQSQSAAPNQSVAPGQPAAAGKRRVAQEVQLAGDQLWSDTGIDVQAGERIVFTATGTLRYADAQADNGPAGITRGFSDLLRVLPFNDVGRGALLGRIGDADTSQPFLIGASKDMTAPISGRLSIGLNQTQNDTATGTYSVRIEVYAATGAARVVSRQVSSLPGIDNSLFAKIPRRITDKASNLGDMVNFLILGSQAAMERAFTTAGWVKVDPDVNEAVLHGLLESLSKESYLTMPMSQLCLFGRFQDYGWAHAEPIKVVASRNHLRIWKAGFTVNGQTLWAGAATHDIGFERDQRNNGVTHKIDPDIDLERDYVEKTLSSTGYVTDIAHFLPTNPLQEARTATGGSFHSNGQVLVLKLDESGIDASKPLLVQNISTGPNNSGCPVSPSAASQSAAGFAGANPAQFSPAGSTAPAATPAASPATAASSNGGLSPAGASGPAAQVGAANGSPNLQILSADYGIDGRSIDVTSLLASKIQSNSLNLRITNDSMGHDPAENHKKRLRVVYLWQGLRYQTTVPEGDTLALP